MSKMDALRAMREAKYAANKTDPGTGAAQRARRATPVVSPAPAKAAPAAGEQGGATSGELCGHRNMGGRTCTRERGHTAKSHRYS